MTAMPSSAQNHPFQSLCGFAAGGGCSSASGGLWVGVAGAGTATSAAGSAGEAAGADGGGSGGRRGWRAGVGIGSGRICARLSVVNAAAGRRSRAAAPPAEDGNAIMDVGTQSEAGTPIAPRLARSVSPPASFDRGSHALSGVIGTHWPWAITWASQSGSKRRTSRGSLRRPAAFGLVQPYTVAATCTKVSAAAGNGPAATEQATTASARKPRPGRPGASANAMPASPRTWSVRAINICPTATLHSPGTRNNSDAGVRPLRPQQAASQVKGLPVPRLTQRRAPPGRRGRPADRPLALRFHAGRPTAAHGWRTAPRRPRRPRRRRPPCACPASVADHARPRRSG